MLYMSAGHDDDDDDDLVLKYNHQCRCDDDDVFDNDLCTVCCLYVAKTTECLSLLRISPSHDDLSV